MESKPISLMFRYLWIITVSCGLVWANSGTWWNLGAQDFGVLQDPGENFTTNCEQVPGLLPGQIEILQEHPDHVIYVSRGAYIGIKECQCQFRANRWNCSSLNRDPSIFRPVNNIESREAGFTHAIMAAGVVHTVTKACWKGDLHTCKCRKTQHSDSSYISWLWGGCDGDKIHGNLFSQRFTDTTETLGNNSPELPKSLVKLHYSKAGRRSVSEHLVVHCKCHGLSTACAIKTCWKKLQPFHDSASYLKNKYDIAHKVKLNKKRSKLVRVSKTYPKPSKDDIVYLVNSPDYCRFDMEEGSMGTQGRPCNRTSVGPDGCTLMCCGRGYNTHRVKVVEECNCKFHWCCRIVCETCEKMVDVSTCK